MKSFVPIALSRRTFCAAALASLAHAATASAPPGHAEEYALVARTDRRRILDSAARYLKLPPATITSFPSPRSPGGPHDFFSLADYFWPNPAKPDGPYINRDGQSNPDNFNDHRRVMIALSLQVPALAAAWLLTRDRRYAQHAADHLRAWFVTPATRMNPNLEFAQGIVGGVTGRSYGIIDTLHLVEVARAASIVGPVALTAVDNAALQKWFREYLLWMQTSEKGKTERDAHNNHAVCWALQAAEFARLIGDEASRAQIRTQVKEVFLVKQMGLDGSFPEELARTKPYSYSIFNFDTLAMLCVSLAEDLINFQLPDGRGMCKGAAFLYPYLRDKSTWPYRKDIEHFDALPVRSPGLLFTGFACARKDYVDLWKTLNPDPTDAEIIRNYPVRQPLLWV